MPLVTDTGNEALGPIAQIEKPDYLPPATVMGTLSAANRLSNVAGAFFDRIAHPAPTGKAVPGFDPLASIPAGYEQYADRFLDAHSPEEIEWTKNRLNDEIEDRKTIERAGRWGTAASMASGLTDPLTIASMAIPVAGETRLAQAGRFALVNGGTTAAQEGLQHELSLTRTTEESAFNIAGSVVLGGILGGAIRPHVPTKIANTVGEDLTRELHTPDGGDKVLGPEQRTTLDTALPSDMPESFYAGAESQPRANREVPLEAKFRSELTDQAAATKRYAELSNPEIADTQGGKVLNVDFARELSPEYVADRSRSAEVHEPASEFVKKMYAEKLAQAPEGDKNVVLFTAGGTGAGKSTAIESVLKGAADKAEMVYDTNMNKLGSATQKVDQALEAGRQVHITYVYRDPEEALVRGALPRAERMGRTVPIEEHAKTHAGAFETIKKLQAKYADNPNVQFSIIDNSLGRNKARLSSMEELASKRYNVPVEELRNALEAERQAGRVSDATYRGTAGHARAAEGSGGVPPNDRASVGGQSEPQRQPRQSGAEELKPAEPVTADLAVNPNDDSTAGAAAVAKTGLAEERIARGARTITEGVIGRVAPGLRLLTSPSLMARKLVQELANTPEMLEKNRSGIATPQPIERKLWGYEGTWYQAWKARSDLFRSYKERMAAAGEEPISRRAFGEEVSHAMRRGDQHEIPEVAQAAQKTRATVFEPLKARAMKLGLLPEDVKAEGADSYLTRQYDARKIRENLGHWLDTLTEGFKAQGVEPAEARDIAHKATRNVLGSERGTMDWKVMDDIVPQSGRLKERTLKLPDQLLEPYLNSDIDHLSHSYLRSMGPEVEMTERFGTRDMKDQIDEVKDDYTRMMERAKARGEDIAPLEKQMNNDLRDLSAIRDRLYGIYGQPKDPGSFMVRAGKLLRSDNALRLLGAATLAHFPDLANVIVRYGMPNTFSAIGRVLSSSSALQLTRSEAKRMGAALDMTMNITSSFLGDYGSHSQFAEQRVMSKLTRAFTITTGETPLITAVQALTSTLAQHEILSTAEKVAAGAEIPNNQAMRLAAAGLDAPMLQRIAQAAYGGGKEPPVPAGMVRYYHGGAPEGVDGPLWFTSSRNDAEGWASRSPDMKVWHVDVPETHPARGEGDLASGIPYRERVELPAELASQRKVLAGEGAAREVNGLRFGMSDTWKDQTAAAAFESAVLREAHGVTLRPGAGDTPLFMSGELGKTILQFKTFAFAANRIIVNPLLQGLANGDLRAIQGMFALAFMGAASYVAKQTAAGQPVELDKPGRLAMEVADKSNLLGWTGEMIFPALWQLGMKDLSRWSDRDAAETLLGPSAGTVATAYERRLPAKLTADTDAGEKGFARSDLHFLRRLMPGQNLWYFRRGVNALEDAIGDAFDLPGESNADRATKKEQ
jgi:hypothetical protein